MSSLTPLGAEKAPKWGAIRAWPHLLVLAHPLVPLQEVLVLELLLHQLVPLLQVLLLPVPQRSLPLCGGHTAW